MIIENVFACEIILSWNGILSWMVILFLGTWNLELPALKFREAKMNITS